jgi:hypothetical protein
MSLGELEAILAALNSSVDDVLIPALGRVNGDLKARLGQIEHEMAPLRQTIASQNDRLESVSDSLRKIERRLQLITPP